MIECILHIGAGKCGSSSLQTHLSENPFLTDASGRRYEYVCTKTRGRLQRGLSAKRNAARNPFGYSASISVNDMAEPGDLASLREALARVAEEGVTPILSFEGWINAGSGFRDWKILEALDVRARVIAFVRPQLPWLNSSWWQWGAWSHRGFEDWLKHWRRRGLWAEALKVWRDMTCVQSLDVFTTSTDVITRFHQWLDAPAAARATRSNTTLDAATLRFLQAHPSLKTGSKAAAVDFVLARRLPPGPKRPPWVFTPDLVALHLDFFKDSNVDLLGLVGPETRGEIDADPAWWSAEHFADRAAEAESPDAVALTRDELEDLARRALLAIPGMEDVASRESERD